MTDSMENETIANALQDYNDANTETEIVENGKKQLKFVKNLVNEYKHMNMTRASYKSYRELKNAMMNYICATDIRNNHKDMTNMAKKLVSLYLKQIKMYTIEFAVSYIA